MNPRNECRNVPAVRCSTALRSPAEVRRSASAGLVVIGLFLLMAGCTQPTAEQKQDSPAPPPREEGVVRIRDSSRQFIEVQEVSGPTSDSRVDGARASGLSRWGDVAGRRPARWTNRHRARAGRPRGQSRRSAGDDGLSRRRDDAGAAAVARASLREARIELERQRRMQQEGVGIERDIVAAETKVAGREPSSRASRQAPCPSATGTARPCRARADRRHRHRRKATVGMAVQRAATRWLKSATAPRCGSSADVFERDLPHVHKAPRAGSRSRP